MLFITLEGIDCSGKTTIGKMIKEQLIQDGYNVVFTREPGGNNISEGIRDVILDKKNINMDPWTESLLYIASRRQHLVSNIIPSIKAGKIVLCDRFIDSTTAYQGAGRGISLIELDEIQNQVLGFHKPELTILFNLDIELAFKRMKLIPKKNLDRLDLEKKEFYKNVHEGYLLLANNNPERIKIIDASKKINDVFQQCYNLIKENLENVPRGK